MSDPQAEQLKQSRMNANATAANIELSALIDDPVLQPGIIAVAKVIGKYWSEAGHKRLGKIIINAGHQAEALRNAN